MRGWVRRETDRGMKNRIDVIQAEDERRGGG
jgi:hypothetical protein